jgi:hemoglobin
MQTVYEAAGGDSGMLRLAHAWHARVMADEVVSHAFSHGFHPEHTERLAAYWAEALGGPATYTDRYGDETSVVRMHSGNGAHEDMDARAIACFDQALADAGLAGDDRLRQVLHDYFAWVTATAMARYPRSAQDVPDGLRIPRWSWDGLVSGSGPGAPPRALAFGLPDLAPGPPRGAGADERARQHGIAWGI